jgi:hypothetical protein
VWRLVETLPEVWHAVQSVAQFARGKRAAAV